MSNRPRALRGRRRPRLRTIGLRDVTTERACTPLELFFDLCFVVAVGTLVVQLRGAAMDGRLVDGAWRYLLLFVPLCRSWTLFSWFVNAFDVDDVVHRVLTFAQMASVLVLTSTVPAAFAGDLRPFVVCFVLMRVPLAATWARAALGGGNQRIYALRCTAGIVGGQIGWASLLLLPTAGPHAAVAVPVLMAGLVALEIGLSPWAMTAAGGEAFHARHLSERFGLFTMIVIGESVLAAATALEQSMEQHLTEPSLTLAAATLVSAFGIWWLYFGVPSVGPTEVTLDRAHVSAWEHGHLLAFATIGAMGAVAEVAAEVEASGTGFDLPLRLAVVAPSALALAALARIGSLAGQSTRFEVVTRCAVAVALVGVGMVVQRPLVASATAALALAVQVVAETTVRSLRPADADRPVPETAGRTLAGVSDEWSRPWRWLRGLIHRCGCGTSAYRFLPWLPLALPA